MSSATELMCVTTDSVPGRPTREVIGLVWGIGVTNRQGDPTVQSVVADNGRHQAYNSLVARAVSVGADAVVGIGFDSFVAARGSVTGPVDREYTVYGTAVKLDPPC